MPYLPYKEPNQLHRERPWVFAYGALLAGVAGFVNVLLLGIYHVPVSHMTGAVARIAIDVSARNQTDFFGALTIFFGFLSGAIVSGLIIGGTKLQPGRRYGVAMMTEGALLTLSATLLINGKPGGIPVAAMACGLQNAMASSYCGLILRTTHVTGMVTDIGVLLGHWIRYQRIEIWRLILLLVILSGFLVGGIMGGIGYARFGLSPLFMVAAGCTAAGLLYFIWRKQHLDDFPIDRWGYYPPEEEDAAL